MLHELGRRLCRKSARLVILRVQVQSPGPAGYCGIGHNPSIEEVETGRTWGPSGQSALSSVSSTLGKDPGQRHGQCPRNDA